MTMMSTAAVVDTPERALMKSVIASVFRPRAWMSVSEWADRYRVIPSGTSYMSGRWDSSVTPYLRGIMDAFSDPEIDEIVVMKSSQAGGTEFYTNALMWAADVSPGPALVVFPTSSMADEYNVDRFTPAVLQTPETRRRLKGGGSRSELKVSKVAFDRMNVYFAGSNSEAAVASKPIRFVICDEVSTPEFMPATLKLVKDRTKAWPGGKIVYVSKPRDEGEGIDALYKESDQRRYEVPCPHCGTFQHLKWKGLKWEGGRDASPAVVKATAWYECSHCKERIENRHRAAMMAAGVWVRKGERVSGVDSDGKPVIVGTPVQPGTKAGFTFSSLYALALPWGYAAALFVEQGWNREYVNGALGEPWAPIGDKAEMAELKKLCVHPKDGGYRRATRLGPEGPLPAQKVVRLPAGIVALVGAVDVQRDRVYLEVRGFGERGATSWLVWYDTLACSVNVPGSLNVLAPIIGTGGPGSGIRFLDAEGIPMRVGAWAIDSGDRTKEVYGFINSKPRPIPHAYATKGRTNSQMNELYSLKQLEYEADPSSGTPAGVTKFMLVNVDRYKEYILSQIKRASGAIDAAEQAAAVGGEGFRTQLEGKMLGFKSNLSNAGLMHFPFDCDEAYLYMLTAEQQLPEIVKSGRNAGRTLLTWKVRPGRADNNHFLDTCVLTHAMADAMGIERITHEASQTKRKAMAAAEAAAADAAARAKTAGVATDQPRQAQIKPERKSGNWMGSGEKWEMV